LTLAIWRDMLRHAHTLSCVLGHMVRCVGEQKTKNRGGHFSFFALRFFRAAAGGCGKMRKMRQPVHGKTRVRACDICGNGRQRMKRKCDKCEKMRRKCDKMRRKCDKMRRKCDEMRQNATEMRRNAKVGYEIMGLPRLHRQRPGGRRLGGFDNQDGGGRVVYRELFTYIMIGPESERFESSFFAKALVMRS